MKRFLFSIFSILAFCGVSGHAFARSETDSTKVYSIGEVFIVGRRTETIPPQVLAGEEFKRLGALSVADAIRYFSGVQVKDYGGIGGLKTVNIRSMGSQHVGVFYDGVQISNAQNGTVDLGRFSLDNMEMLSLYNGQKSDIFQSAKDYASASAVYMVSRRPSFDGERNENLNITLRSGSFDLLNVSSLWEYRANDRISSSANVEFLNTSGKYKYRYKKIDGYDVTETRRNGDVWSVRGEAALFGATDRGEWMAKGYFYNSERGYPGAAVKKDYAISLLNEDRQKDRSWFVQGSFRHKFSDFYSLRLQARYANDYMNYIMPLESTVQPMDNHYWQREVYMTAANLLRMTEWWTANISVDGQWNRLDADGTKMFNANFVKPRRYSALGVAASSINFERFSLQGSLLYTFVHDQSARGFDVADDKHVFTPTVIASCRPLEKTDLDIRAFYKKIFRMPTFNDLYYVQIGNRLLKPEYTTQYNVGLAYRKHFGKGSLTSISATVDAYYNEVTDKIIATPTTNQLVWTMLNLDYVEIRGMDVAINPQFRVGDVHFGVRLTYTCQKAQDFTKEKNDSIDPNVINTYGHQIPYIPRHSGSAILNLTWRGLDINYSFIYTGKRYRLGSNVPVNYIQPWYTHDLSVSYNFKIKGSQIRASAEVNNIFNQQYEVVKWYPMPGANCRISLNFKL